MDETSEYSKASPFERIALAVTMLSVVGVALVFGGGVAYGQTASTIAVGALDTGGNDILATLAGVAPKLMLIAAAFFGLRWITRVVRSGGRA
jgi:hypothetical protein